MMQGRTTSRWVLVCLVASVALLILPIEGAGRVADPAFAELLPPSFNRPTAVVGDAVGDLWFAEEAAGRLGRVTRRGEVSHINLPQLSDRIESLVLGPDGTIWFAASNYIRPGDDYVGRVAADGRVDRYPLPRNSLTPGALTAGAENELWLLGRGGAIYRVATDGRITPTYQVQTRAQSIVLGPDGNLWVGGGGRITRITASGEITEYPLSNQDWEVYTLIVGPDDALWFIPARFLSNLRVVGRITTGGTLSEFPIDAPGLVMVGDIIGGPHDTIWLTLVGTNLLGALAPDGGSLTTVDLPQAMQATPQELKNTRLSPAAQHSELLGRGPDGGFWFTRSWRQPEQVGYRAPDGAVTTYPLTSPLTPLDLAIGPDKAIWFTEGADWFYQGAPRIGRLGPGDAAAIVHDSGAQGQALKFGGMVTGPDGNLWAIAAAPTATRTEPSGLILRIAPSGQITGRFVIAASGVITTGPDGALWFTQSDFAYSVGRITTDGQVSYIALPTRNLNPSHIVAGPDGNLWITGSGGYDGVVWRVNPSGKVTTFTLPKAVFLPLGIVAGPDGNLWFAADMTINRITPDGRVTSFRLPGYRPALTDNIVTDYVPRGLTVGPDGNLWFTRYSYYDTPSTLGRITMDGTISEYPFPAGGSDPGAIISGADGKLYVSARGIRQLIRVDIGAVANGTPVPASTPSPSPSQPTPAPTVTPSPLAPTPSTTAAPPPVPGMPNTGTGAVSAPMRPATRFMLAAVLLIVALPSRRYWPRGR